MPQTWLAVAVAAALMSTAFAANEVSHGGAAEAAGMGHRHMLDHGGIHCADPTGPMGPAHADHMHADGSAAPHDHCGKAHHVQDHRMGGMHNGTHGGGMHGGDGGGMHGGDGGGMHNGTHGGGMHGGNGTGMHGQDPGGL